MSKRYAYPVTILYVIASSRVKSGFALFLIQMVKNVKKFCEKCMGRFTGVK